MRKPGKLPGEVQGIDYSLEYGSDRLEIHQAGFEQAPRVLIVDDLLATGGTAAATAQLVQQAGGEVCGFGFVIELADLGGRSKLPEQVPVVLWRFGLISLEQLEQVLAWQDSQT